MASKKPTEKKLSADELLVRQFTDKVGSYIDRLRDSEQKLAFICHHSQRLFPGDYLKGWGSIYGIGLGKQPVSECLDSKYYLPLPDSNSASPNQMMYPVGVTRAQVSPIVVSIYQYARYKLITETEDPSGYRRSNILKFIQWNKPNSKLKQWKLSDLLWNDGFIQQQESLNHG